LTVVAVPREVENPLINRPQYWKDELNRELIRLRRLLDGSRPECNGAEDLVMRRWT
jgi:hypothetical protein